MTATEPQPVEDRRCPAHLLNIAPPTAVYQPDEVIPWTCDTCTAGCTFEAMQWCAKRWDPDADCAHEAQKPLALHGDGTASPWGCFEFRVPKPSPPGGAP